MSSNLIESPSEDALRTLTPRAGVNELEPLPPEFTLVLKAISEPGVSAETVKDQLVRLYAALNDYTLARYGRHLTREQFRRLVYEESGVPV